MSKIRTMYLPFRPNEGDLLSVFEIDQLVVYRVAEISTQSLAFYDKQELPPEQRLEEVTHIEPMPLYQVLLMALI